ncbi:MAG: TetR/AcrR family transcriptional regulator [Bifidobacteriaceae bacterium]|jgi:AcrR family transcriptional regulator|nr:TetR/AcrR family transcriptional regulator [Bifidobacteriaceae bacterium]
MRTVDEKKVVAIKNAVLDLVADDGLTNLTTAKVAKRAGVSPATIYVYYSGKVDMLSRIYEEEKAFLHDGLAETVAKQSTLDAKIAAAVRFSVGRYQKNPREARFVNALWSNREQLDEKAVHAGLETAGPLLNLYEQISTANDYVDAPKESIAAFFTVPVLILADDPTLGGAKLDQVCAMVVRALKK